MINVLLHRISVRPFDRDEWDEDRKKAKSLGFALPESPEDARVKASIDIGTILEIGPTAFKDYTETVPVKVGDIVAYVKNAGKLIKNPLTDEEVYMLNDIDLLAVFTKE